MEIRTFFCFLTVLAITGIEGLKNGHNDPNVTNWRTYVDGMDEFSSDLYNAVKNENLLKNVVVSPLSVNVLLNIFLSGADGNTKNQILEALHLPTFNMNVKLSYSRLIKYLTASERVTTKILNKLYVSNEFSIKEDFNTVLVNYFQSKVENLDFKDSVKAADTINSWISTETNEKIKELFTPDTLSGSGIAAVNVLYFKGEWLNEMIMLNELTGEPTSNRDFYTTNGNYQVPMMNIEEQFNYGVLPEFDATFVEIPFKDVKYFMMIILPNQVNGLATVERKLGETNLTSIREKGSIRYVNIVMPEFKIESKIEMKNILQSMGLRDMFTTSSNLNGISNESMHVNDVVQKCFIAVNKFGVEAAAASGSSLVAHMLPSNIAKFNVNHPFYFKIVKNLAGKVGITLFEGSVKSF
ncbi:alaserpin-like [Leptopilina heterotoma]|uniref:alaserpin-like n=1 Tax=Leptopilina heterotoma TaxID=63436 RepID=UPI001CA982BB|nr:alaserpin-like [Leptopilina heterotoma]